MRTLPALALLALAACAPTLTPLPRPAGGYEALRLVQSLDQQIMLGRWQFAAGTLFVQDRLGEGGERLWCTGAGEQFSCIEVRDDRVRLNAQGRNFPDIWLDVPAGAFERVRL